MLLLPTYATNTELTVNIIISNFILVFVIITMMREQLTVTRQWWHLLTTPLNQVFAMKIISGKELELWLNRTFRGNAVWCYWGNTRMTSIYWARRTFLYPLEKFGLNGFSKTMVIEATAQEHVAGYVWVQIPQMGLHLSRNALRKGKPEERIWEENSCSWNRYKAFRIAVLDGPQL